MKINMTASAIGSHIDLQGAVDSLSVHCFMQNRNNALRFIDGQIADGGHIDERRYERDDPQQRN